MKVTRDNASPIELTLTVELAEEDENPFIDRSYRRTVSRVNIPGFRRGKAPRHIVERMLGRPTLLQEALDFMVPETLDQVLREQEVEAFAEPSIEITDLEPVSFTATIPLEPTVDLGDYLSIRVESDTTEVIDEDVDRVIERIQQEQAVWEPVERAVEYGDRLNLNVRGAIEDETVVEDDDVEYVPEEANVLPFPGFAPNLLGMVEEEEREFTVTIPEDYPREQYAGKDVQFQVTVLSVKEKNLPELDDEFAKSIGEGFDDLEALRANILESLTSQAESAARNQLEQQSLEALCEAAVVNASPILFERELESMQEERDRMLRQQNLDLTTYLRFLGKTLEEFREEMRPNAERRLTSALVMRKLAQVEEIEISDEDVQSETDRLLGLSSEGAEQDNLEQLREYLGTESTREGIRGSLHSRRVMERLTEITQGNLDTGDETADPNAGEAGEATAEANAGTESDDEADEAVADEAIAAEAVAAEAVAAEAVATDDEEETRD